MSKIIVKLIESPVIVLIYYREDINYISIMNLDYKAVHFTKDFNKCSHIKIIIKINSLPKFSATFFLKKC